MIDRLGDIVRGEKEGKMKQKKRKSKKEKM